MKKNLIDICKFLGRKIKTVLSMLFFIILLITGLWMSLAMPIIFRTLPPILPAIFSMIFLILLFAGLWKRKYHVALLIMEVSVICYFATLTPQEQFKDVKFQRIFATKPEIRYLDGGKFEVINLRKNRYADDYDETVENYNDIFVNEVFDLDKVNSMDMAVVHWGGMDMVAHIMFNFKFTDGKELTVSVEPRTPVGVDREAFTCLCKQQELLFILSDTEDLFELRRRVRGENIYIFETTFSPQETRAALSSIIGRIDSLYRTPEFYDLFDANCITAFLPSLQQARPGLRWDARVIFNGYFDRLLWEQNVLKCREGESFESLKSRSFIKGKSQGKL